MAPKRPIPAILFVSLLLVASTVWAREPAASRPAVEKPDQQRSYIRLVRGKSDQPIALDTAIVRFARKDGPAGPTVDLVAAVHVADGKYYDELNRRFQGYDVVLYELVAPAGTKIPEGKPLPANNPISFVQKMLRDVLELEFQLERVRYNRPNMVHADMSPQELAAAMERRGESVLSIILRMMLHSMAQQDQAPASDMQLLMALLNPNRALALKRIMSEQFQGMEGSLMALGGPKGSSLIEGRNQVALDALRRTLDAGEKKIAIFYGGGHMRDLEKRLRKDFAMVPVKTEWLTAWEMRDPQKK